MDRRYPGLLGLLALLAACTTGQEAGLSRGATLGAGIGLAFAPDDDPEPVTLRPLQPPLGGDVPIRTMD